MRYFQIVPRRFKDRVDLIFLVARKSKKIELIISQLFSHRSRKKQRLWQAFLVALFTFSWLTTVWVVPTTSAERISFDYGVFGEFYISIADLETFAKTGEITPSLAYYADRFSPEDLAKLRDLLNQSFDVNVTNASTFLNLPIGRELTRQIGLIIDSPARVSQPAIRASLILAAAQPEGLTILNVLRLYSTTTLRLNSERIFEAVDEATKLLADTERVFQALKREARREKTDIIDVNTIANLETLGTEKWRIETITFDSAIDKPKIDGVVYLPVTTNQPVPVVVIAPGLNTNWQNFAYIAEHLASYGFGVAAVNFPGTNARRIDNLLNGLDTPPSDNQWVKQPKIVSQLLDEIERKIKSDRSLQGKLNLQKVGIIGQSLGGYTAMAIAGAKVDWQHLQNECQKLQNSEQINFNPALFWQCQAPTTLPPTLDLEDERIVAAIAINPVTNPIFSKLGISQLESPLMMVSGDRDFFAPALDEQLKPFTWLPKNNKYLVLVRNSTHFSFIGEENNDEFLTPTSDRDSVLARSYLKTLGVAFFKTYLTQQDEFSFYLTESYLKSISKQPLPINILRAINGDRLQELIEE